MCLVLNMIFCHIFKVGVGGGFFKEYQNEVYFCYLYIKAPPLQLQEFKNSIKIFFIITHYIYILECPVFGSIFSFDCSQAFSGAGTWKNKICEVLALLVEFCDYTSPLKLKKSPFLGQKTRFSRGLCSQGFEDLSFFIALTC